MGRFHRHDAGTGHNHGHDHDHLHDADHPHSHDHDHSHDHGDHAHPDGPAASGSHTDHHVGDHSGYDTGPQRISVLERIFDENDAAAAANRALLDQSDVVSVNLMSSPGSGKTALLAAALERLQGRLRVGVVEGDIETALDAQRLSGFGAQIALLNTGNGFGGECHLDAPMVARALRDLDLEVLDLVVIENVGNLVCPAEFDVGAHRRAMVFSVTEGEDKPLKYPVMFRSVDTVVVNKVDLLPYVPFAMDQFLDNLRSVNPEAQVIETSVTSGAGLDQWVDYLVAAVPADSAAVSAA
jgi:hydrogenase nickel incorporation protein HypB